jgi:uncharacterized repeat protein (TIGR01451 family)
VLSRVLDRQGKHKPELSINMKKNAVDYSPSFFSKHPNVFSYRANHNIKSLLGLFVMIVFLLNTLMISLPLQAAADDFLITKSVDKSEVFPGENFTYTINYSNILTDATNAILTDQLPANVVYVSSEGSKQVDSIEKTGTPGNEAVIFHFQSPLPAGSTGILKITVKFPEGTTLGGAANAAVNSATIVSDEKAMQTSNQVTVTPKVKTPDWSISKEKLIPVVTPALGQPVTYRITVRGNSLVGGLNMQNVVITDTLPVNATYVSSSDSGVYDSGTGTITFPTIASLAAGQTVTRQITLIYNDPVTIADTATNSASASGTPLGASTPITVGPAVATHGFAVPNFAVASFTKSARQVNDRYSIGQEAVFSISGIGNTGNVPMDRFVIEDTIPDIITLNSITAGSYNQATYVDISYQTNLNAAYRSWTVTPLSNPGNPTLLVSDLSLGAGEWVTQVRWDITGATPTDGLVPGFAIQNPLTIRATVNDEATSDITNHAAMTAYRGADTFTGTADRTIYVIDQMPWLVSQKTVHNSSSNTYTSTTSASMQTKLYFRLRIQNHAFATGNYIDPVAVDVLPSQLENITYTGYALSSGSVTMSAPTVSAISGNIWEFDFTGVLAPGEYVDVFYTADIKDLTTVGLYENALYISTALNDTLYENASESVADNISGLEDLDSDGSTTDRFVKGTATFFVNFSGSLNSGKLMKGSQDTIWSTSGSTLPGGTVNYQISIANTGSNGPISNIVAIDKLPVISDTTVLGGAPRLTEWRPYLVNEVTYHIFDTDGTTEIFPSGATIDIYYSTSTDLTTAELYDPLNGTPDPSWTSAPPADITSVKAIKFLFSGFELEKDQRIVVEWPMRAPYDAPANLNAYNSFGYGATYPNYVNEVEVDTPFLPSEPNKVVFNVHDPAGHTYNIGNFVWEDMDKDGIQDAGENGINGVLVNLYDSSDVLVSYTRTGDSQGEIPGYYLFPNVPEGDYYLEFVYPQIYQITDYQAGGGTNAATDSDIVAATRTTVTDLDTTKYSVLTNQFSLSGADNMNMDAGLYQYASLGDRVWNDADADGIQDAGELGIVGITVELLDGVGGVVATTVTGVGGAYLFSNVDPGSYRVRYTNPSGNYKFSGILAAGSTTANDSNGIPDDVNETTATTGSIILTSGEIELTVDQGMYLGRIGNFVFTDNDADGIQDAGEGGFAGVTVRLYFFNGTSWVLQATSASTTTANPNYLFDNLNPGSYYVHVTKTNAAAKFTKMDIGANDAIDSDVTHYMDPTIQVSQSNVFTLTRGERNLTIDIGVYRLATIGDRVWYDPNGNGIQDTGESGLAGVTVRLLNLDGVTPATYEDGTVVPVATTNVSGMYSFTGLEPGIYKVRVDLPSAEYIFSPRNAVGGTAANNSDVFVATGLTDNITLTSGTNNSGIDAGVHKGMIGNFVWQDTNANGIQDAGEPGISGVTVSLYKNNVFDSSTTTSASGAYSFTLLDAGTYRLEFAIGGIIWFITPLNAAGSTTANDSNINSSGVTTDITLNAGDINLTIDAGYYKKASVGDRIWSDIDSDGIQDAGEIGIPNVEVTITFPNLTTMETVTDANGNYLFEGLIPGTYTISIDPTTLPANYQQSYERDGSLNGSVAVTLSSGDAITDVDFGYYLRSNIGDKVWEDTNANGIQDVGENGLAGITVTLYNSIGGVSATTTTDSLGNYLFSNLLVGTYTVGVTVPGSWAISPYLAGSDTALDSNIQVGTGRSANIVLLGGQNILTIDAGLYERAQIGDTVWFDVNGNGIQDEINTGASGVTVRLLDQDGDLVATTTTDIAGEYLFANLVPGQYQVQVVLPTGYGFTIMNETTSTDLLDSDFDYTTGRAPMLTITSGQSILTVDAGLTYAGIQIVKTLIPAAYDASIPLLDEWSAMPGSQVTYIFQITNTGTTYLDDIVVTDSNLSIDRSDMTLISGTEPLAPGASIWFYYTTEIDEDLLNVAYTDGNPCTPDGTSLTVISNPSDTDDAQVYALASVGDRVWNDLDADGVQDSGEPGIPDVRVILTFPDDSTIARLTDADGLYLFSDLVPGTYEVSIDATTLPDNYRQSFEQDSTNDGSVLVTLYDASIITNIDFGYYIPASVGDRVWEDMNGNGLQDAGEPGIANVKVTLTLPDNSTLEDITDANGNYLFPDLTPGDYTVSIDPATLPDSVQQSFELDGTMNGAVAITLISDSQRRDVDFGYFILSSVGNYLWIDTNRDGVQQDTEIGMANVTVRLYNSSNTLISQTSTDALGKYLYSGLVPGSYYVTFASQNGYIITSAGSGADIEKDSNADTTGRTATFTVVSGSNITSIDAGLLLVTDVSGKVVDKNNKPIPGAEVIITDVNGVTIGTAITDVNGDFIIRDVPPNQTITITFAKSGYITKVLSVAIAEGDVDLGSNVLARRISSTGETTSIEVYAATILMLSGLLLFVFGQVKIITDKRKANR